MMKRGISPLISSVLLIAFVIALFLVITSWVQRDVVSEGMGTTDKQLAGHKECLDVNFDVNNLCVSKIADIDPDTAGDQPGTSVMFNAENTGEKEITGLRIIGEDASGSVYTSEIEDLDAKTLDMVMQKTEDNLMKDGSELDGDYDLIRIEIYPEFEGGLCKNKIEIITNVEEC